ncbi:MAG: hypothetical protein RSD67_01350 [Oscillospiraceae bacterium]
MLRLTPVKNVDLVLEDGTKVSGYGYDGKLFDLDVGKIRAYIDIDTVIIEEINEKAFRELTITDGLIRATLNIAVDKNILFYKFNKNIIEQGKLLESLGYNLNGDYIYKFFTMNKHCNGDCSNCSKH